jgi:large conductance mechanosensitive channel
MKEILIGFKAFLLRGNLIELAVAFVIALAFAAVINSFVTNLVTPILALIIGKSSLGSAYFEIGDAVFYYGQFIDDVIQFIAIAAAIYFFVVVPYTRITDRMKRGQSEEGATTKTCPECITTIPLEARRCPACTSQLIA